MITLLCKISPFSTFYSVYSFCMTIGSVKIGDCGCYQQQKYINSWSRRIKPLRHFFVHFLPHVCFSGAENVLKVFFLTQHTNDKVFVAYTYFFMLLLLLLLLLTFKKNGCHNAFSHFAFAEKRRRERGESRGRFRGQKVAIKK